MMLAAGFREERFEISAMPAIDGREIYLNKGAPGSCAAAHSYLQ
jgi:hypothetical protein